MGRYVRWRWIVGAWAIGLAFACVSQVRRQNHAKFHQEHAGQVECAHCHEDTLRSERLGVAKGPHEERCLDCHEKTEKRCESCHKAKDGAQTCDFRPRTSGIEFSHAKHLEVVEGRCQECHSEGSASSAKEIRPPRMLEVCMSCHRRDFREIRCKACHSDLVENPVRPVRLFSHDADFRKRHAELAKGDERVCAHCHRPDFCSDCHTRLDVLVPEIKLSERVDRDLPHRHDFLTRHAIEARADPSRCWTCHEIRQCNECHQARKAGGHPPGWMDRSSGSFHGREARRDIVACASCHDRGWESNCVRCHRVGGAGGNPHPPGFGSRLGKGSPVCRACHR